MNKDNENKKENQKETGKRKKETGKKEKEKLCEECLQAFEDASRCKSLFKDFAEGWIVCCCYDHIPNMIRLHKNYTLARSQSNKIKHESKDIEVDYNDGTISFYCMFRIVVEPSVKK